MGVRADSIVSGEELVGRLMETRVSGRKVAKMRKSKGQQNFQKKKKQVVPFITILLGGLKRKMCM